MAPLQSEKVPRKETDKSKDIRRFGINEGYQMAMYILDQYRGTVVTCRHAIPSRLASSDALSELKDTVEGAVAEAVLRHPLLQVGIKDAESKRPVWIRLDSMDLSQHIEWRFLEASENMASLVHQITGSELNSKFSHLESRPGWRILVLHERGTGFLEIMFNFNHVNLDGIGARIFHEDLLECLNSATKGGKNQRVNNHILPLPDSLQGFPLPIEKLCKLKVDANYAIKTLWQELRPPLFCKGKTQADWAPTRGSPYNTELCSFSINASSLASLVTSCRKHKTTITGLLHSLALMSLASRVTVAPGFASGTPLDLRRYLPTEHPGYPDFRPDRTIANYVTVLNHEFPAKLVAKIRSKTLPKTPNEKFSVDVEELVWSVAAKVRVEILEKLELGTKNDQLGLGKFIPDWQAHLSDQERKPRQQSWIVTNLGVVGGSRPKPESGSTKEMGGSWSICGAQFTNPTEVPASALMICPVTVAGGPLCVSCSWQDNVVDAALAQGFMGDIERWMIQMAS